MMNIRAMANTLNGEAIGGDQILCPGPYHPTEDRSMSIKFDADMPDGFVVESSAGDDLQECRDHIKESLGIGGEQ